ncbi:HAD family hydrolase [Guptibacillus algicola]|uniref:HAD family hydrolase n=1 Tax=Guptibacillus algicola TaxID=225844 RepID=UPI001CD407A4|nr:HAD-IA family hydrolase [Alkalihalobacillus algicola]MCA0988479.1 HAD family hydrolase [Alkalihalobacillus algicola]
MIKTILFDLDGTLLNRDASVKAFIDDQYDRLSHVVSHIPRQVYIDRFIALDQRGYVWKDKVYQQMVSELELKGVTWEDLLHDYITEFQHHCVAFPKLIPMLEELKDRHISLGMITNGFGQFQMNNIEALGIKAYFEAIFISEWEGLRKPDPKLFHRALTKLKASKEESMFIGDHPDNDVRAARNLGMKAVWKRDDHFERVDAVGIVDDLMDLPTLLDHLNNKQSIK